MCAIADHQIVRAQPEIADFTKLLIDVPDLTEENVRVNDHPVPDDVGGVRPADSARDKVKFESPQVIYNRMPGVVPA